MPHAVLDLYSSRRIWQPTEAALQEMREAFAGAGWRVSVVRAPTSSDGDGAGVSTEALTAVRGAEVYIGWGVAEAIVEAAGENLRWAHTAAAGVGGSLSRALIDRRLRLTNSRGVHAEPIADWVLAAVGFCVRGFHAAVAAQRRHRWAKDAFTEGTMTVRELRDTKVGIAGLGGVGRAVARRCVASGCRVRGIRARPAKRVSGVEWVGGPAELPELARWADVLLIAAPETAATRGMVDAGVLGHLRTGSFVVNVSRGSLLDEPALRVALDQGRVAGAVLDVFATEPLPSEHWMWDHPGVFITPHVSAVTDRFWEREAALVVDNVGRYLTGRRLRNIVNLHRGY